MPGLGRTYNPDERDLQHLMRDYEGLEPSPTQTKTWQPGPILNQGETPHCVGFGWRGHLNAEPNPESNGPDANDLYYACKEADGEPKAEDGSSVRTGAKVCIGDKLVDAQDAEAAFLWAFDEASVRSWILAKGPVVFGTNWYRSMFTPNPHTGIVAPSGQVAGGHCFLCIGFDHFGFNKGAMDLYMFQNSWGDAWGEHGFFYMQAADVDRLLKEQGEACTVLNLAPLAPVPVEPVLVSTTDESDTDTPKKKGSRRKPETKANEELIDGQSDEAENDGEDDHAE